MSKTLPPVLLPVIVLLAAAAGFALGRGSRPVPPAPTPAAPTPVVSAKPVDTATPAAPVATAAEAAGFRLLPPSIDLGELREGQGRQLRFKVERPEGIAVRLAGVKTSCPCLQVVPGPEVVAAGRELVLDFELSTLTMSGAESKRFVVEISEPQRLTLSGEVTATVKRVPAKLLVTPTELHLGLVREPGEFTVTLWNLTKSYVKVGPPETTVPGASVSLSSAALLAAGRSVQVRLRVVPGELPAGPLRGDISITTDLPEHQRLALPVDGTVVK